MKSRLRSPIPRSADTVRAVSALYRRLSSSFCGILIVLLGLTTGISRAEPERSRFAAGGYFRVMTRPDLQGGNGKLGYWNLHGRLLNEGPWAALELRLDLVPEQPGRIEPWTSVHAKIEGGSVSNATPDNGSLAGLRLSQLYARAGHVGLADVVWQLGTLDYYFGDLGLYDLKPAQLFFETVGLSARYKKGDVDLLVGVGDSGFWLRREQYNTVLTAGAALRLKLADRFELGLGGQMLYEPQVDGNRLAPHSTPGLDYERVIRGEVISRYDEENPSELEDFPTPLARSALGWKAIFYLGFGAGPLRWNNLFAKIERRLPDQFVTETFEGRDFVLHVGDLTDERTSIQIGNEAHFSLIDRRLELVWSVLFGVDTDADNDITPTDFDRTYYSTVMRLQGFVTDELHLLLETSLARERSHNGNAFRSFGDSVFRSTEGITDARGLEFGDSDTRDTWQLKVGPVLSPLGVGAWARPSFRLLYGLQWSSQINAFGNSFVESLDQLNQYGAPNQRWHHLIALEVEAWF
jgi:hypothetical protein